jgi:hypothetical protein
MSNFFFTHKYGAHLRRLRVGLEATLLNGVEGALCPCAAVLEQLLLLLLVLLFLCVQVLFCHLLLLLLLLVV